MVRETLANTFFGYSDTYLINSDHGVIADVGSAPCGANDEFLIAATARTLRKLAKVFPAPQQTGKHMNPRTFALLKGTVFHNRKRVFVYRLGGRDHRMFPGQVKFIVHAHHRPGDRGHRRG